MAAARLQLVLVMCCVHFLLSEYKQCFMIDIKSTGVRCVYRKAAVAIDSVVKAMALLTAEPRFNSHRYKLFVLDATDYSRYY